MKIIIKLICQGVLSSSVIFSTIFLILVPESTSELSDFEGRIRALNEELKKRKMEADRLKLERKKRRKEDLKNKEETLKKQLEVWWKHCLIFMFGP